MFPTTECNLRCKYCFHAKGKYEKKKMSIDFIDRVFEKLFADYEYIQFIWHGGEPLCMGLDFYKDVISLEQKYSRKYNVLVDNGLMTNGTLITDESASFFREYGFDVGVSYDGLQNDYMRGKSNEVISGINTLKKYNCDVDIVTVINNTNLYYQIENYEAMKVFHSELKYNPVARIGGGNDNADCYLNEEEYVNECCKMFDYWLYDQNEPLKLQPYFDYLRDIVENTSSGCQRTSCLGRWIALHPNGDVYPCVRETKIEYRFGNLLEMKSTDEIWESAAFFKLLETSVERRERCKNCTLYKYCHGGCPVNALTGNGEFSCSTFREIFNHVFEKIVYVKEMEEKDRNEHINPLVLQLLK